MTTLATTRHAATHARAHAAAPVWPLLAVLLLPLVWAPLPQGSIPAAPRALLSTIGAALGAVALLRATWCRRAVTMPAGSGGMLLLIALALWQVLPLGLPATATASAWLDGLDTGPQSSVVPSHTWQAFAELVAALVVFAIAAGLLCRSSTLVAMLRVLLALGAALSAYGILVRGGALPPIVADLPRNVVCATFYNRNHCAAFLAMATLAGCGLWWARFDDDPAVRALRRPELLLTAAAILLGAIGLLSTASRAGAIAAALGVAALLVGRRRQDRPRQDHRRPWRTLGIAAVVLSIGALLVPTALKERLDTVGSDLATAGRRPDIWKGGVELGMAFPVTGSGLGTYADVSPLSQPAAVPGRVEHAHCEPLEVWVEGGLVGLLCVGLVLLRWGRAVRAGLAKASTTRRRLAAGCVAALVAVVAHGMVDFPFRAPAIALWCAALAGAAIGVLQPTRTAPVAGARTRLVMAGTALVLAAVAFDAGRTTLAAVKIDAARSGSDAQAVDALAAAALITPGDGTADTLRAERLLDLGRASDAADAARAALRDQPLSARALRTLAVALACARDAGADDALARGLQLTNPYDRDRIHRALAERCLNAGAIDAGLRWLRVLLEHRADLTLPVLRTLWDRLPAYELVRLAVPDSAEARRTLAQVLLEHGDFAAREQELAALRGERAAPGQVTIDDGVVLVRQDVTQSVVDGEPRVQVELGFRIDRAVATPALALRCDGEHAASWRPFDVEPSYAWTFRLDSTFPPGTYRVTLQVAPHALLPLTTVTVPDRTLALGYDDGVAADELFWSTAVVDARQRDGHGVPLHEGDVLAATVRWPGPGTLVVECRAGHDDLEVTAGGVPLATEPDLGRMRRFAVPAGAGARLEIRSAHDAIVEHLLLLPKGEGGRDGVR